VINKKMAKSIVNKAVDQSFKDGKLVDKQVNALIKEFSSLSKAESIKLLTEYQKGIKRELRKYTLVIESATPLPKTTQDQVKNIIKKHHLVTSTEVLVNPGLLGGIKIKIADEVYEASLLRQIEDLGRIIANG
jgi:F0F1-type ATP synthase delta subunit